MLHQMRLQQGAFDKIKSGNKILEMRVCDEKRRKLELGDKIEFSLMDKPQEKVVVEIIGLLRYERFADLISDLPAAYLGYRESEKEYLKNSMYEIYTPEEEKKYGVLGIRIRLVK